MRAGAFLPMRAQIIAPAAAAAHCHAAFAANTTASSVTLLIFIPSSLHEFLQLRRLLRRQFTALHHAQYQRFRLAAEEAVHQVLQGRAAAFSYVTAAE
jgi:hypothetical protein